MASDLPFLLINPPLTDPTTPYHSLSYVSAAAKAAGYVGGTCLDANIEALNYQARPEVVAALIDLARTVRERIECADVPPTRLQELEYRHALLGLTLEPADVQAAVTALRSADSFYDFETYRAAVETVSRWIQLLPLKTAPGMYSRSFEVVQDGMFDLDDRRTLTSRETLERIAGGFSDYLDGPFNDVLRISPWRFVGLSIAYASQLPIALAMARRIRDLAPDAVLVAGGTEVSDLAKFCPSRVTFADILAPFDVVVLGEGESAVVEILRAVDTTTGRRAALERLTSTDAPGVHVTRKLTELPGKPFGEVMFEDLASLPTPDWGAWDWDAYWSPENVLLYSPTRGCYWNKCTFCDYGLNTDAPTAPSREVPPAQLRRDLAALTEYGRTVYFAVDAMSPRYIRTLLEVLEDPGTSLRWSAELRLERNFPQRHLGPRLAAAGCVAVSFGYESGSQRILDLIDKGVRLDAVPSVLRELSANNIGVQMMGFIGFPTEREEEALETFAFLQHHAADWTIAGIGDFALTSGSIVARQPSKFGIRVIRPDGADSVRRVLTWRPEDDPEGRVFGERTSRIRRASQEIRRFAHDRPFVGGIDSGHTILYFARNGRELVPSHRRALHAVRNVWVYDAPLQSVADYTSRTDIAETRETIACSRGSWYESSRAWLDDVPERTSARSTSRIGITAEGAVFDQFALTKLKSSPRTQRLAAVLFPTTESEGTS